MRNRQGIYLYGLVPLQIGAFPGCKGIGNPPLDVHTIPLGGVSVLASYLDPDISDIGIDDAVKHVKVLETMMGNSPVIPIRFGTVTESLEELKKLTTAKKDELKKELQRLDGKFEVGIKAYWRKEHLVSELAKRFIDQHALTAKAQLDPEAAITLGQRVQTVVDEWREDTENKMHPYFSQVTTDNMLGEPMSVEMLYNGSFLVNNEQETKLKIRVEEMAKKNGEKIEFHYTTMLPPYNFVNIELSWRGKK
jgi:hypothetical protein